jgi:basic membrane protein A
MKQNISRIVASLLFVSVILAACAPAATPAPTAVPPTAVPPTVAPTTVPATAAAAALKVGLVTDTGGPDDKSFNATAIKYLVSRQQTDYAKNIEEFVSQGYTMIVTVGFLLGVDTATEAKKNPKVDFSIVDYTYPDCFGTAVEGKDCGSAKALDNVLGLHFQVDQAAFMAGYLAASVSKTKKVGTYGGVNIPPVVDYMVGFEAGVKYWNAKHTDTVAVLGWSTTKNDGVFTGTFTDPDKGKAAAQALIDQGADVVLPVAGLTGNGAFTAAASNKVLAIGVDTDQCVSLPDACPVLLTSVLKNMDVAVEASIKSVVDGSFKGGVYNGTLDNNGVGLADYHTNASKVTAAVQTELTQIKADLIAGKIDIKATASGK